MTQHHTPAGPASHTIIPAGPSDTGTLGRLIADAFFPLAPSRWLVPDGAARREMFPGYFGMLAEHVAADGIIYTTTGRTAAALWIAAGPDGPGQLDGYDEKLADIAGPWATQFVTFDMELDAHHLAGVAHHHLAILAVRPDLQGQGIGTALLQAHHAVLDEAGIVAYLEASDERTRGIYLRHGYTDHGSPIELPAGPQMYPMVRQPQANDRTG